MEAAPPTFAKATEGRPPPPFTGEFYYHNKLIVRDFKLQSARQGRVLVILNELKNRGSDSGLFFYLGSVPGEG